MGLHYVYALYYYSQYHFQRPIFQIIFNKIFSVIRVLLSISLLHNGLSRLLYLFSVFSTWVLWLDTIQFWTNFSHFLCQHLQSFFCHHSISMVILNSGLIWLKMDISLLLKMPYLRNKMPDLSTSHQYQIQVCTTLTRTNLLCIKNWVTQWPIFLYSKK